MAGAAFLRRVHRGASIDAQVVVVVAHPDDETFGLGGSLGLLSQGLVVQLTDGVTVESGADAARVEMRRRERQDAWTAAGWHLPVVECHAPDQAVHRHLSTLLPVVRALIARADVVVTHPYEGGHPDHDAAAFLVQRACDDLAMQRAPVPDRVEFASYHFDGNRRRAGAFWPDQEHPQWSMCIAGERLAQKQRAFAAYRSQASVATWFDPAVESYRLAPRYDFRRPPPTPGRLYERKGWSMTADTLLATFAEAA